MQALLDTSIFIGVERGLLSFEGAQEKLSTKTKTCLSAVTASELLVGVHHANTRERREQRETFVEYVLASFPILPFNLEVARAHAHLKAEMQKAGNTIGPHDLMIAATALAHGFPLLTANAREFKRVKGLEVVGV